jgi:cell filamentation protein
MPQANDAFIDPYVYPDSRVLRNLLHEHDEHRLSAAEYELTFYRRRELEKHPVKGSFDLGHLREIHRRLFQDVYPWAGEIRTVEITKGNSSFHSRSRIETGFAGVHEWLTRDTSLLSDHKISDTVFVEQAADLLEKVNYLHPFREGNGRTQRAFLDQVASLSDRKLAWRNIGKIENERASIKAFSLGSGEPFRPLLEEVLKPPLGGLSLLDDELYTVSAPGSAQKNEK